LRQGIVRVIASGKMRGVILGLSVSLWLAMPAEAASITVNAPDAHGRIFVDVVGEIVAGDEKAFEQKVAILHTHVDKVIVTLSGPGGAAFPAMKIGELIHENGWTTYVSSGNPCTSSCSIIWLAGAPRTIEGAPAVIIGFHAIYNKETERESGAANAILGHHLTRWGINELGVACVTINPPNEMGWLTGSAGRECGITWEVLTPARDVPLVIPPAPTPLQAQPAPPLPQPSPQTAQDSKRPFRVVNADDGYLNIRNGPGPKYGLVTAMPLGETGLVGRCVPLDGGYLPFCEVEWRGSTGWASSCCISDMEQSPSPQQLQPQAPQAANELSLFCTNISDSSQNPRRNGVIVRAVNRRAGWSLRVIHKINGQLFDRTEQYRISAFHQDQSGPPSYFWDGVLGKDPNVLMTGHLWQNAGVWMYEEHIAFRDGQPGKLATPPTTCQPVGQQ
jgi:hypothetical protein